MKKSWLLWWVWSFCRRTSRGHHLIWTVQFIAKEGISGLITIVLHYWWQSQPSTVVWKKSFYFWRHWKLHGGVSISIIVEQVFHYVLVHLINQAFLLLLLILFFYLSVFYNLNEIQNEHCERFVRKNTDSKLYYSPRCQAFPNWGYYTVAENLHIPPCKRKSLAPNRLTLTKFSLPVSHYPTISCNHPIQIISVSFLTSCFMCIQVMLSLIDHYYLRNIVFSIA